MFNLFNIFSRSSDSQSAEFARRYKAGFLKKPIDFTTFPRLGVTPKFVAPNKIDERFRMTATADQGYLPQCAAYAAWKMMGNIYWRKNGYPCDSLTNPALIYADAKRHDGDPSGDGTTIPSVLDALKHLNLFSSTCQTRIVNPSITDVKFALHKFGVILGGFNITEEWYKCNPKKTAICSKNALPGIGGHCVAVVGYDKDGLYILNSWSEAWGEYGYALITWKCFQEQFIYGGVLDNCLDGIKL